MARDKLRKALNEVSRGLILGPIYSLDHILGELEHDPENLFDEKNNLAKIILFYIKKEMKYKIDYTLGFVGSKRVRYYFVYHKDSQKYDIDRIKEGVTNGKFFSKLSKLYLESAVLLMTVFGYKK